MSTNFISFNRDMISFLPPTIQDWLPENHLARFVVEIVSQLDIKSIKDSYSGRGSKAYHPEMLLALLFYGYATGVFSSRNLESATYDSVAFRYITADNHPDHDTISTFRKRFLKELKPLFVQILLIAKEMGLLKLGTVSLDGTKVKANASKHHALSWDYASKLENQLEEEVDELLKMAEQVDKNQTENEMNIPDEIARRKNRLSDIAAAKAEIEKRAKERYLKEKEAYDQKMADRAKKERESGKKVGGKKPKPPVPGPRKKDQLNLTDADSKIMPTASGFEQSYNAQAGVEVESLLIVENHLTQNTNDKLEIEPALNEIKSLPNKVGKVNALLSDTGYFSEANVEKCEIAQIVPYIGTKREKHHPSLQERFGQPSPLEKDADSVSKMKHRLQTKEGKKIYAKRKSTIEPVFGVIKHVIGFRQFLLRGLESVTGEWNLVCVAYNLKKLHKLSW